MTYTYEWNRGVHGGWDLSATSIDNPDESSWVRVHIFSHGMYYIYSGPGVVSSWGKQEPMELISELKFRLRRQIVNADNYTRTLHGEEPIKATHPLDQLFDSYVGEVMYMEKR